MVTIVDILVACHNGDTKECRVAWEQYDELKTAILRKNEKKPPPPKKNPTDPNPLSIRKYDV
jgi:hypothetical protein